MRVSFVEFELMATRVRYRWQLAVSLLAVVGMLGAAYIGFRLVCDRELQRLTEHGEQQRESVEIWAASQPPVPDEAKKFGPRVDNSRK